MMFNGVRQDMIRTEAPVRNEDGFYVTVRFKTVDQAAEGLELVFLADGL